MPGSGRRVPFGGGKQAAVIDLMTGEYKINLLQIRCWDEDEARMTQELPWHSPDQQIESAHFIP